MAVTFETGRRLVVINKSNSEFQGGIQCKNAAKTNVRTRVAVAEPQPTVSIAAVIAKPQKTKPRSAADVNTQIAEAKRPSIPRPVVCGVGQPGRGHNF